MMATAKKLFEQYTIKFKWSFPGEGATKIGLHMLCTYCPSKVTQSYLEKLPAIMNIVVSSALFMTGIVYLTQ